MVYIFVLHETKYINFYRIEAEVRWIGKKEKKRKRERRGTGKDMQMVIYKLENRLTYPVILYLWSFTFSLMVNVSGYFPVVQMLLWNIMCMFLVGLTSSPRRKSETLGEACLALHYANLITRIDAIVSIFCSINLL